VLFRKKVKHFIFFAALGLFFPLLACSPSQTVPTEEDTGLRSYSRALQEYENGNYDMALELVERAIMRNDRIARYFELRADVYAKQDKAEKALKDYNDALRLRSNYARVMIKSGRLLMKMYRFGDAISYFNRAHTLEPAQHFLHLAVSECYLQRREYGLCINKLDDYRREINLNNARFQAEYFHVSARLHFEQERYEDAQQQLETYMGQTQMNRNTALLLVYALIKNNEDERAYTLLSGPFAGILSEADRHYFRAVYYMKNDNRNDAKIQARLAVQKQTEIGEAYTLLQQLEGERKAYPAANNARLINIGLPDYLPL